MKLHRFLIVCSMKFTIKVKYPQTGAKTLFVQIIKVKVKDSRLQKDPANYRDISLINSISKVPVPLNREESYDSVIISFVIRLRMQIM